MAHSEDTEEIWSDIREHARLLGDGPRTDGLVEFLSRHAPGRTVLEVGCGTGMLSCIAARMGATHVLAVERTGVVAHARRLVEEAGLSDIVEVVHADIDDLDPEPRDVVFSELLNADPFTEGVIDTVRASADWVAPDGILAPDRLELHLAMVAAADADAELAEGRRMLRRLAKDYDLPVQPLVDAINAAPRTRTTVQWVELRSTPSLIWSGSLAYGPNPPRKTQVTVTATGSGRVSGAAVWFRARYDDELVLANPPEDPGHWGIFSVTWPHPVRVQAGRTYTLPITIDPWKGVDVLPPG